jgi:small subunit ribosomal protein S6
MVILDPESDESAVGQVVDRIKGVLSAHGGEPGTVDTWGKRKLAFEIDHKSEGVYFVLPFTGAPEALTELERILPLADEVVRFKITRAAA